MRKMREIRKLKYGKVLKPPKARRNFDEDDAFAYDDPICAGGSDEKSDGN